MGSEGSGSVLTIDTWDCLTQVARGTLADDFGFYWDGELLSAQYGGQASMPYTEGQDPDLDTTDNIDPNAGYQPPDTEEPEPTPPPDDYSDLPVAGFVPPALPGGRSVTYYVDRGGNRQQVTDTANATATYTANNINQYSSVSGCSITNGPEHEVSLFQGPTDPGAVNYYYINDEHLKQVSDSNGNNYYLYYDALGRCVSRTLNGTTTTYYIYDGEKPILEYTSSTGIVGRNVYGKGIDEILMRTDPGVNSGYAFYYAQDHEGSVTHLLDGRSTPPSQTGNVIEQYKYDVFGGPTIYDASWAQLDHTAYNNRFLFTGREYAATYRSTYVPTFKFYEYRARAYNPTLGRFMSEDPKLFDAGDYNLFRYCHNDPIDLTDPMGTDPPLANSPRQESLERYEQLMATLQMKFNSAIAIGMQAFQIEKHMEALQRAEKRFESSMWSEHPQAAQKLGNWGSQVVTASRMLDEWSSGRGPTERVFGPNSLQSRDLRSDSLYQQFAQVARATGKEQAVPFGPIGAYHAGLHPTRQFVGGYRIVPNVMIGDQRATVIYNVTSMRSFLYDHGSAYTRGQFGIPGGNTYQYYITEVSRPGD